jgi:GPCR-chaperone
MASIKEIVALSIWRNELEPISEITLPQDVLYSGLKLSLKLARYKLILYFLEKGASFRPFDGNADKAILYSYPYSKSHRELTAYCMRQMHLEIGKDMRSRVKDLEIALQNLPDFTATLSFNFSSYLPGVSSFLPTENVRLIKNRKSIRLDFSLSGMSGLSWRRGDLSLYYYNEDNNSSSKKPEFILCDHVNQTFVNLFGPEMDGKDDKEVDEDDIPYEDISNLLDLQLTSPIVDFDVNSVRSTLKGVRKSIFSYLGSFLWSSPSTNEEDDDDDEDEKNELIGIVEDAEIEHELVQERIGQFLAYKYKLTNLKVTIATRNPFIATLSDADDDHGEISAPTENGGSKKNILSPKFDGDEHKTRRFATLDELKSKITEFENCDLSSLILPTCSTNTISFDDYISLWDLSTSNLSKHTESKHTTSLQLPPFRSKQSKDFTATVYLAKISRKHEHCFPFSVSELLPIFRVLAKSGRHFANFEAFLKTKFPSNKFPVSVTLPLFVSVSFTVKFLSFEILPSDASIVPVMKPPTGYTELQMNVFFDTCGEKTSEYVTYSDRTEKKHQQP